MIVAAFKVVGRGRNAGVPGDACDRGSEINRDDATSQAIAPEEVCVNYVAEVALKMLPEDLNGLMGKTGSIEMYFDRNER